MRQHDTAIGGSPSVIGAPVGRGASLSIGLGAAIVAATVDEPRVLTIRDPAPRLPGAVVEALPSGFLETEHRTLEIGLRGWVERQTSQTLGYVEQLYTFGDRDRVAAMTVRRPGADRRLSRPGARGATRRLGRCTLAELVSLFSLGGLASGEPAATGSDLPTTGRLGGGSGRRGAAPAARRTHGTGLWRCERLLERGARAGSLRAAIQAGLVAEAARDLGHAAPEAAWRRRGCRWWPTTAASSPPASPPARQDQIPPGGVRTDAAGLHAAATAAHGRGARRACGCTSRISADWSSSRDLVEETGAIAAETGGRPAQARSASAARSWPNGRRRQQAARWARAER